MGMKKEMKKEMKKLLKEVFEAPKPIRKEAFLRKLPKAQISHVEFMILQTAYINKWLWMASAVIFGSAVWGASYFNRDMMWTISALMPFIALSITVENAKSAAYGMEELEMASRFSIRSVLLARLGVLGLSHLLLLCLLLPAALQNSLYTPIQTGIYLTVPYLLTVVLGMMAARKFHGKESLYVCTGLAVMISVTDAIVGDFAKTVYRAEYFVWWLAAFFILLIVLAVEWKRRMERVEEWTWSLQ